MKAAAIAITLCLLLNTLQETETLGKQALGLVQRTQASDLDPALPNVSLGTWFNQLVGPHAGVIWQLSECEEALPTPNNEGTDLPACMQAIAVLPNGRKVVIAILIGTFRRGLADKASFRFGVVEYDERLRAVKKLSDLPRLLSAPNQQAGKNLVELPEIDAGVKRIKSLSQTVPLSSLSIEKDVLTANLDSDQLSSPPEDVPPPPTRSQSSSSANQPQSIQKVVDEVLEGNVITRVEAVYPPTARMMGAFGTVQVQVTISETGSVIEARAISGHKSLRSAAVDAAYKWVFKPTTISGSPTKVEGILSFRFKKQ
jgi:TonB family protein